MKKILFVLVCMTSGFVLAEDSSRSAHKQISQPETVSASSVQYFYGRKDGLNCTGTYNSFYSQSMWMKCDGDTVSNLSDLFSLKQGDLVNGSSALFHDPVKPGRAFYAYKTSETGGTLDFSPWSNSGSGSGNVTESVDCSRLRYQACTRYSYCTTVRGGPGGPECTTTCTGIRDQATCNLNQYAPINGGQCLWYGSACHLATPRNN